MQRDSYRSSVEADKTAANTPLPEARDMTRAELEEWAAQQGLAPFRGRQIFRWLWNRKPAGFQDFTDISRQLRQRLPQMLSLYDMEQVSRQESCDGTIKWGLRLADGAVVETVLIPEEDHTTICISTQAGCAMGCAFCLTARMGFVRNLTPGEIAGQALTVIRDVPRRLRPRNIVFMGMGEPLANLDNLLAAIDILSDDMGLNFSVRRMTVSTSGLVPQMLELGRRSRAGLAVSLHATSDEIRDRIMPVNRRYPLAELMDACRRFEMPRRRRITFEYLMLKGVNDSQEDAKRLISLLQGIRAKVNLIPFNPCPDIPFEPTPPEGIQAFQEVLRRSGLTAIVRKSKGQDILAACGQLSSKHGGP